MDKRRAENKIPYTEEQRMEELDWNFQMVNDYPLSDKTLVVNPQTIPLSTDELPETNEEEVAPENEPQIDFKLAIIVVGAVFGLPILGMIISLIFKRRRY